MMTRFKLALSLSIFGLALFYWAGFNSSLPKTAPKGALAKLSDLHITHLNVHFFDAQGHQTHALASPKMEHVPYHDTYHLLSPRLHFTPFNKPHWVIRSDEAVAKQQAQKIILSHHVILKHAPFQTHPAGRIETERLSFYPKQNYATTKETITWKQQGNLVVSQGMNAYFNQNRMDLFQTKAIYEPNT